MSKTEIVRKRKPAARRTDIVLALMDERLGIMESIAAIGQNATADVMAPHIMRLRELGEELRRSLNKNADSGEGE